VAESAAALGAEGSRTLTVGKERREFGFAAWAREEIGMDEIFDF
jgi:hypothetical protein